MKVTEFKKWIFFIVVVILMTLSGKTAGASVRVPFRGHVDLASRVAAVELFYETDHPLPLMIRQKNQNAYFFSANIKDFPILSPKVSTILEGRLDVDAPRPGEGLALSGSLQTRTTLIDFRPAGDFTATFRIADGTFFLDSFSSKKISGKGRLRLVSSYTMDWEIEVAGVDVDGFLSALNPEESETSFGPFVGQIRISGDRDQIGVKGKLDTRDGWIDGIPYEEMLLKFDGTFPFLAVDQSHIVQQDGMISQIAGVVDLSNLKNLDKQIRAFVTEPLVQKEGEDLEWTLKRLRDDRGEGTSEVKTMLRQESDTLPFKQNEGAMFGLERKMKF